jgi:hypothetical protein
MTTQEPFAEVELLDVTYDYSVTKIDFDAWVAAAK